VEEPEGEEIHILRVEFYRHSIRDWRVELFPNIDRRLLGEGGEREQSVAK